MMTHNGTAGYYLAGQNAPTLRKRNPHAQLPVLQHTSRKMCGKMTHNLMPFYYYASMLVLISEMNCTKQLTLKCAD